MRKRHPRRPPAPGAAQDKMPKSAVRILVTLQNPATEDSLVRLAATLAREPWGELHLTHVVTSQTRGRAARLVP